MGKKKNRIIDVPIGTNTTMMKLWDDAVYNKMIELIKEDKIRVDGFDSKGNKTGKKYSKLQIWWWSGKIPRWFKWKLVWYIKKNFWLLLMIVLLIGSFLLKLYQVYKPSI